MQNRCARANFRIVPYGDVSEHRGVRSHRHPLLQLWMSVTRLLSRAPKRDSMKQRTIIVHHRSLTNHYSRGVVYHDASAELGTRMEVHAKGLGYA